MQLTFADQKTISSYLERYGHPSALQYWQQLKQYPKINLNYKHVVVVPVCAEKEGLDDFLAQIKTLKNAKDVLLILVLNEHIGQSENVFQDNQQTLKRLQKYNQRPQQYGQSESYFWLWLLNFTGAKKRFQSVKGGVGLARRIGCDLALKCIEQKWVATQWIHNLDADVKLPRNYFNVCFNHVKAVAYLYPYQHLLNHVNPLANIALADYEGFLNYLLRGLNYALSAFAYSALGSLICVHAHAYAQVRGMPKLNAGEDFHFLNKLRKLGHIATFEAKFKVFIHCRTSTQTPFGTAHSTLQYMHNRQARYVYHPHCFRLLKSWNIALSRMAEEKSIRPVQECVDALPLLQAGLSQVAWYERLSTIIKQLNQTQQIRHAQRCYFDALFEIKLIRCLNNHFPQLLLQSALELAPFTNFDSSYL